jgi:hypothetical protein
MTERLALIRVRLPIRAPSEPLRAPSEPFARRSCADR